MKIKPTSKTGGVLVELSARESKLPEQALTALPAFRLKKILVPVDFSVCSKKALQYAIPFARQFDAELILLHVEELLPSVSDMGPIPIEIPPIGKVELESVRRSLGDAVRASTSLRAGAPHVEIAMAARELGIDLIILSTHGRTGLSRVVLGSTAEKVVRHAPCPVLVVRETEREFVPGDTRRQQNEQ